MTKTFEELEEDLRLKLTDEFCEVLIEAAKVNGWSNDFVEVERFVLDTLELAGKERTSFDCYHEDYDDE